MSRRQLLPRFLSSVLAFALLPLSASAIEYHVSAPGSDSAVGSSAAPFKTIGKAASVMQAGDTCTVHAGTYREWVKPPRSGSSDTRRIVYRAAAGEVVKIKGSERIANWVDQGNGVWKADLQEAFFNGYNPYAKTINWDASRDSYLGAGGWHHRGDVYLDETALNEKASLAEVQAAADSWFCSLTGTTTSIYANFGPHNPNTELAEVNVRHSVFWPDQLGIAYITVDGFTIMHSAEEWSGASGSGGEPQWGAIGPRWGLAWIIQNCRVKNARVIGICIGNERGSEENFAAFGHHVLRNNWISHCGQAGIAGERGCVASTLEGNLIEDIDDRQEFGGWEGGGIKLHFAVDVLIRGNCIRRVKATNGMAGHAIWLDWTCQNSRITGNVLYGTENGLLNLEVFQGPVLFDNNVFIGDPSNQLAIWSSNVCFANNLFCNVTMNGGSASGRTSPWFAPHSLARAGSGVPTCGGAKVYNNVYIGGANGFGTVNDVVVDYNAYLQGAQKSNDAHAIADGSATGFAKQESGNQVSITFNLNQAPFSLTCPRVTSALLGTFQPANVSFTHPDNTPMDVDTDYFGNAIPMTSGNPGPFQDIAQGSNTKVLWPKNGGPTLAIRPAHSRNRPVPYSVVRGSSIIVTGRESEAIANLNGRFIYERGKGRKAAP